MVEEGGGKRKEKILNKSVTVWDNITSQVQIIAKKTYIYIY